MASSLRSLFPWFVGVLSVAAIGWAVNRGTLERADFTFCNGTEVKSLDPAIVTGQPEQRMLLGLFEGLARYDPKTLKPLPAVTERWDVSDDGRVYTFHLRSNARWSDGSPVTAQDFAYSLRRFLDPRTAAQYSYLAWYIKNAKRYSTGGSGLSPGDPVEIELNIPTGELSPERRDATRGKVLRGTLLAIQGSDGRELDADARTKASADTDFRLESWTFVVDVADGPTPGKQRFRYASDERTVKTADSDGVQSCRQALFDFRQVGVDVVDPLTLQITLTSSTPFFVSVLSYYPLFPVNQRCVEKFGSPDWTEPENIVVNGAYRPLFRRIRDRTRLVRNDQYWDREHVQLETIDVLATEGVNTMLNLYMTDQVEWIYDIPPTALRALLAEKPPRPDINPQPILSTYFYMLNITKKPLDDVRVRRALALAVDRREITDVLLGAGERPAYTLTPPGIVGYDPPPFKHDDSFEENVAEAKKLLADAGFPGGRGFPTFSIVYNTHETHQAIAELVRKQWQQNLGIKIRTRNEEFASLLASQHNMDYDISRRSWGADYADPNSFLDMYVTDGENNSTGFSMPEYDRLIADAARENDPDKRLTMFRQAEQMLMDAQPIIPIHYYVSKTLLKPYVRGFYNNALDMHPLSTLWLDREGKTPVEFTEGRQ